MPIYNLINTLILVWFSLSVLNLRQLFISHFYIFSVFRNKRPVVKYCISEFSK